MLPAGAPAMMVALPSSPASPSLTPVLTPINAATTTWRHHVCPGAPLRPPPRSHYRNVQARTQQQQQQRNVAQRVSPNAGGHQARSVGFGGAPLLDLDDIITPMHGADSSTPTPFSLPSPQNLWPSASSTPMSSTPIARMARPLGTPMGTPITSPSSEACRMPFSVSVQQTASSPPGRTPSDSAADVSMSSDPGLTTPLRPRAPHGADVAEPMSTSPMTPPQKAVYAVPTGKLHFG